MCIELFPVNPRIKISLWRGPHKDMFIMGYPIGPDEGIILEMTAL